jgi:MOSC domain-containing protein YiiM
MITLLSVNVGALIPLQPDTPRKRTGIYKRPATDAVEVTPLGLIGDRVGNLTHHGGPDQAVYLYGADDYAWWSAQGVAPATAGSFGENLTLDRWWPDVRVGDRLQVGEVMLELTAPRIPCGTLATRMGDPQFVKRFARAERCGAYARVLQRGTVQASMTVEVTRAPSDFPLIRDLFRLWYERPHDHAALQHALETPLASRLRAQYTTWLGNAAPSP